MFKKTVLIILILTVLIVAGCTSGIEYPKESVDALANCLAEKGVKEYGAFWCPNCAKQEKLFGDSMSILKEKGVYIECDPRCDVEDLPAACKGIKGQPEFCLEKNVNKYPDWEFPNGERVVGVQELSVIAQKAGCTI